MAEVEVAPVKSRRDQKEFVQFAWKHYAGDPNWVPPLRDQHKRLLGYKHHPFQTIAEVQTFLARRNGRVCGRIAAILNREHNRCQKEDRGFWGFFECIDDQAVATALFDAVAAWFAERNITSLRGPANPSMNYECGLLVDGFDDPPTFMMTYNPPYYEKLVQGCGFQKSHDLYAYIGYIKQLPEVQEKLAPIYAMAAERLGGDTRPMDTRRFKQEVELFLEMYNRASHAQWGFVPLTSQELQFMAKDMKHLMIPELSLAGLVKDQVVGAVLGLPDYNPTIKKIDGRLFPFGFLRLLKAKRHVKRLRVISIAVVPEYQRWGMGLVLIGSLLPKALAIGVEEAEFSWIVETNRLARGGLEKGGAKIYKTYRMYDR